MHRRATSLLQHSVKALCTDYLGIALYVFMNLLLSFQNCQPISLDSSAKIKCVKFV